MPVRARAPIPRGLLTWPHPGNGLGWIARGGGVDSLHDGRHSTRAGARARAAGTWSQAGYIALAFGLSSLIGLEREWHHKDAGLRTHTLVGVGAALFVIVSKYGFADVLSSGRMSLDPSRVAAQVVTGIGFIGGGLIFVRRDIVHGLTTAAIVWLTAAIGMACGAGLLVIAIFVAALHFVVALGYAPLARRLPSTRMLGADVRVVYRDGEGVLREVLSHCTSRGFSIDRVSTNVLAGRPSEESAVAAMLDLRGRRPIPELLADIGEIEGVLGVSSREEGR